jgi:S-methylmethionine-dependent homocysteine/selenocysteine methylase
MALLFFSYQEGTNQVNKIIEHLDEWIELGAKVIGGCCRVYPDEMAKIGERMKKKKH